MDAACERMNRKLAVIAHEAPSAAEYRAEVLRELSAFLGADKAVCCHTVDGRHVSVVGWNHPQESGLSARLSTYAAELKHAELERALGAGAVMDDVLFDDRRKAELRLYTEHLARLGVRGFLIRLSLIRGRCQWYGLTRIGQQWRFADDERSKLDALAPVLQLGEIIHGAANPIADATVEEWLAAHGVRTQEARAVLLLRRGLSNAEIAQALGKSVNTVRNQLAASYTKLGVSSRAELLWELGCLKGDVGARSHTGLGQLLASGR